MLQKLNDLRNVLIDLSADADRSRVDAATAKVQLESTKGELERLAGTSQSRNIILDPRTGKSALCTGEYIQAEKRKRAEREEGAELRKIQTMTRRGRGRGRTQGR